jgi:hypothetical protein
LTQSEIVKGNQQRLQGIAGVFLFAIAHALLKDEYYLQK